MKDKVCMTISVGVGKAFDKFQHLFMMKAFNKLGIEKSYLSIKKLEVLARERNKMYTIRKRRIQIIPICR